MNSDLPQEDQAHVESPTTSINIVDPDLHDEIYFFELITFRVEGTKFRVPAIQLTNAHCFQTMSCEVLHDAELNCDVIQLKDIKKTDFKAFLKMIYPLPDLGANVDLNPEEWISVLRVASNWGIVDIRNSALLALCTQGILPVTKIQLAEAFHAPSLQETGILALIKRETPLTLGEAELIGIDAAFRILAVRDYCFRQYRTSYRVHFKSSAHKSSRVRGLSTTSEDKLAATSVEEEYPCTDLRSPNFDDVGLVCLARESKVVSWIQGALQALVRRDAFLSMEESVRLGLRDCVGIGRAREAYFLSMRKVLTEREYPCTISFDYEKAMNNALG